MEIVKAKVGKEGIIKISKEITKKLNLKPGEEIDLGIKDNILIIRPRISRRRKLHVEAKIIDELVEKEEIFEPEWT